MGKTLLDKVWEEHTVRSLPDGRTQLLIGTHLIHEVTSPQAFGMLRDLGLKVLYPHRTFATVDHIVPTDQREEPFSDPLADAMVKELRKNCAETGVTFFDLPTGKQGIVHIVGPEQGITQPGTTIACGDSHTSTHGAFGAIAFGIGTSQVRDVLATQTMAIGKPKVRRINVDGKLAPGVYAKDVILHIIRKLGVNGGIGYAYEYGGSTFNNFTQEERMTVCNMAIEGGARVGYVNPDQTTFEYLRGRPYSPKGTEWDAAVARWKDAASDKDAVYDDVVNFKAEEILPTITWGITPAQAIFIDDPESGRSPREGPRHRGRGNRAHEAPRRHPSGRHQDRCCLPRQLHQRTPLRPSGSRQAHQGPQGGREREGDRRTRIPERRLDCREDGHRGNFP